MEIPPCVLQDIGPLGPLPKKYSYQRKQAFYDLLIEMIAVPLEKMLEEGFKKKI